MGSIPKLLVDGLMLFLIFLLTLPGVNAQPFITGGSDGWLAQEGSEAPTAAPEKTPDGGSAAAFRCVFSDTAPRVYWDRNFTANLATAGKISFYIKAVGDTSAISGTTLYFRTKSGWYNASLGTPPRHWKLVTLDKSQFSLEDTPEGWSDIEGVRLAFWKAGKGSVTVYMGAVSASTVSVGVIREGKEGEEWAKQMGQALNEAGIESATVEESDLQADRLKNLKFVILPYNPALSEETVALLQQYTLDGGHLLACYQIPDKLITLLGLKARGWTKAEYPGQFSSMRKMMLPTGKGVQGYPVKMRQTSWNILNVIPDGNHARVLANWYDAAGKDTGLAAVILGDKGAYISHVLMGEDPSNRARLLLSLIGHYMPDLWSTAVTRALENAAHPLERWETSSKMEQEIKTAAQQRSKPAALKALESAHRAREKAQKLITAGRGSEALDEADNARNALELAWQIVQPTKQKEFRAVWVHSPYGVEGMTWDQAIRHIKECGFNAVVVNMLWGGEADYNSKVLPINPRVAKEGDQITICLAACRKYDIQLHVWKVDWNLGNAADDFVAKMRAENRLQRRFNGQDQRWLCPSNPDNREMEFRSMLEVANNYAVDGIHFDYIRYPDQDSCYCDGCRERFEKKTGQKVTAWPGDVGQKGTRFKEYQQFRRDNISALVQQVSEEMHKRKPDMKVSAAVFSNWPNCREDVGQDWGMWIKKGWLDFACPMDYTESDEGFSNMVRIQLKEAAGKAPIYPGIGASAPGLSSTQVIEQVRLAREAGAPGFILFQYDARTAADHLPALSRGVSALPVK